MKIVMSREFSDCQHPHAAPNTTKFKTDRIDVGRLLAEAFCVRQRG